MPTRRTFLAGSTGGTLSLLAACRAPNGLIPPAHAASGGRTLSAYRDEAELVAALGAWRTEAEKRRPPLRRDSATGAVVMSAPMAAAESAAPAAPSASAPALAKAAAPATADSITNVQTAGVDEGGIVKQAGDYLVVLRRGRLFTLRVGGDQLVPAGMSDAYGPDVNPQGAWYDELLISGDTVVVVGYSYQRGGTEIALFELGGDGSLRYRATHHLRSFDYYSSRNYASRLIGRRLIFYTPTIFNTFGPPPLQMMPGYRRWQGPQTPASFERILPATRVYRTDDDFDPTQPLALHTVTICDLDGPSMRCESTAVLGPAGRVFYVSQGSVYVWTNPWRRVIPTGREPAPANDRPQSAVFRIPLDGSAPTGLKTAGAPIDQLSFLEDAGHLNVLLRESGSGEGMWGAERTQGQVALLRVPLSAFGDGRGAAQKEHYRLLPAVQGWSVQNRYVGDWLLYSATGGRVGPRGPVPEDGQAIAVRFASADAPITLRPGHSVERIEAMGGDAVLVGNAGSDLMVSSVRLGRSNAAMAGRFVKPGARQGETRTHGFFYRPTGEDGGLLGLPVLGAPKPGRPPGVYAQAQGSASVMFLRQQRLEFNALGELEAQPASARDDACKASCVDWYGNARPIFLGSRVFALLGYELVEGRLTGRGAQERLEERRRVNFSPTQLGRDGRYSPFGGG